MPLEELASCLLVAGGPSSQNFHLMGRLIGAGTISVLFQAIGQPSYRFECQLPEAARLPCKREFSDSMINALLHALLLAPAASDTSGRWYV